MLILGISAFYHDSAATLIKDGVVVNAFEEERFTRVKHDNTFPYKSVKNILEINNLKINDLDAVSYYEKPLLKLERILSTFVETYPKSLGFFLNSIPEVLGEKLKVESIIRKKLGFKKKIYFIPHHLSHASVAFLTSGFRKASILTIDGAGDDSTTELWLGKESKIKNLGSINFPHSVGLLYSTFTSFLGFRVNFDEFKVMGLAAYGKPIFKDKIVKLIKQYNDGSFKLDLDYFSYTYSNVMWSEKFERTFGKPRKYKEKLTKKHKDLAASLQSVTEDLYMNLLNVLYGKTKCANLCVAGGVGLNSLANGKIYSRTPFKKVHIFGPAGDSGGSLGAALYTYINILGKACPKKPKSLYLGNKYSDKEIVKSLEGNNLKFKKFKSDKEKIERISDLLAKGKIVGWFQGRMEFGPRALGNRSILANPKSKEMKDKVNKIKRREEFRPFAGSILQDQVHKLFEVPESRLYSPFMNFCFATKDNWKGKIAAIVHNDGTTRIQTVNKDNGLYYELIKRFYQKTGIPCVLNTSFNLSHEPIVESPEQAIWDFENSSIDVLVMGSLITYRNYEKRFENY